MICIKLAPISGTVVALPFGEGPVAHAAALSVAAKVEPLGAVVAEGLRGELMASPGQVDGPAHEPREVEPVWYAFWLEHGVCRVQRLLGGR